MIGPFIIQGHLIKNPGTQRAKSLLEIPSAHRIIISGTPLQNNLKVLHYQLYQIILISLSSLIHFIYTSLHGRCIFSVIPYELTFSILSPRSTRNCGPCLIFAVLPYWVTTSGTGPCFIIGCSVLLIYFRLPSCYLFKVLFMYCWRNLVRFKEHYECAILRGNDKKASERDKRIGSMAAKVMSIACLWTFNLFVVTCQFSTIM